MIKIKSKERPWVAPNPFIKELTLKRKEGNIYISEKKLQKYIDEIDQLRKYINELKESLRFFMLDFEGHSTGVSCSCYRTYVSCNQILGEKDIQQHDDIVKNCFWKRQSDYLSKVTVEYEQTIRNLNDVLKYAFFPVVGNSEVTRRVKVKGNNHGLLVSR